MNTPPPVNTDDPAHASGLLATIREALRGSHLDYTTAPVGRAVIMLAVPMVMEMAMEMELPMEMEMAMPCRHRDLYRPG